MPETTDGPCVVSLGSDSAPVDGSFEALRSVASTSEKTHSNVNGAGWHNGINTADSFLAPINTAHWNVPESPDGGVFAGAGAGLSDAGNEYQESFYTDVENLETGKKYTIQFWQASVADKFGRSANGNQAAWEVHFGNDMQMSPTLTYQDNNQPSTWSQVSVTFTASAPTERLEFTSKSVNVAGGPHGWMNYILVDGITVLSAQPDCQTSTTECTPNSFLDFVQADLQNLCMAKQHGFLEHSLGSFAGCISEISTWLDGNCATGDCSTCVQGFQAAGGCACLADSNCDVESKIPPNCNQCALPATQSCSSGCTLTAPSEVTISNQWRSDNGVYTLQAYDVMPGKPAFKHFRTQSFLNCCESTGKWGLTKSGYTACDAEYTYWHLNTASCSVCDLNDALNGENQPTTQEPAPTFERSQVGKTCRPRHQTSGSYCNLPSGAVKLSSAEECLSKCEAWEECVCGVAIRWKSGEYLCNLFTDSNDPPSALTCKTVLREDAFPGATKPYGKLTCGDEFRFGDDADPFTQSTRRINWKSKSGCSRDKVIDLQLNAKGMTRSEFTAQQDQLTTNLASSLGVKSDQVKLSLEPFNKRRTLTVENSLLIYVRIEATTAEAETIRSKTQSPTLQVEGVEFEVVQMDVQPLTDDVKTDSETSGVAMEIFVVVALLCLLVGLFGGFGFHHLCYTEDEKTLFTDDIELPTFKQEGSSNTLNATANDELQKSWQGESMKMS